MSMSSEPFEAALCTNGQATDQEPPPGWQSETLGRCRRLRVFLVRGILDASETECAQGRQFVTSLTVLEQRVAAVEKELAKLKQRVESPPAATSWIDQLAGTFKDDPEFDEIVKLGREFRESVSDAG